MSCHKTQLVTSDSKRSLLLKGGEVSASINSQGLVEFSSLATSERRVICRRAISPATAKEQDYSRSHSVTGGPEHIQQLERCAVDVCVPPFSFTPFNIHTIFQPLCLFLSPSNLLHA